MAKDKYEYETIKIQKDPDGVTWLIMNRPEKRNAMSPQLHADCSDALYHLATDKDVKVLILTGAGDAFCAGQDLRLFFRANDSKPAERFAAGENSHNWRWTRLSKFPKATIAMVNGFCFGGGFTQLIACDLAVAADDATFGLSEVNWGIIPGGIVSWNVVNAMNSRDAMFYAITGDTFTGKEAARMGLVNYSVPAAQLREETLKLARKLAAKNPATVRYTKEGIRAVRGMSEAQAADYLAAKSDALRFNDAEGGREESLKQFLDEKKFRPGLGNYVR
ncbi:p-hydroxycinnamoyl CoA hydratase/lyase [Roseiarcaceae bacterium H3SJ34-1]|uniref:p-hydroxycinnamoyl CoA hydratase/lyase n=1 Tax=Terripilifer ovatus TaxID=3032367 RepID=UPI003AB9257F|nr:p-hydroxycinnamoyl CoA hydratase/lyase [Roseiarcaceae bacterium H3SJ34-1]